MYVIYSVT